MKYDREWMMFAAAALARLSDGNDAVAAAKQAAAHADAMVAELDRRFAPPPPPETKDDVSEGDKDH